MISALFLYDTKGDVLMSKVYKAGVKRNIADVFRIQVISNRTGGGDGSAARAAAGGGAGDGGPGSVSAAASSGGAGEVRSPVLTLGSTSFVYIRSGLVWICAVTRSNQDCGQILEFLHKLESLLMVVVGEEAEGYGALDAALDASLGDLGSGGSGVGSGAAGVGISASIARARLPKTTLTVDLVTNNFNTIYELLDEVVEFGYPTSLDLATLRPYMTSVGGNDGLFRRALLWGNSGANSSSSTPSNTGNGGSSSKKDDSGSPPSNVPWRPQGIKYRRNEIFLNVEEKIHVLLAPQGDVLRSYVDGKIQMKTHLSGMPECKFGLGDGSVLLNEGGSTRGGGGADYATGAILEDSKFHQCVSLRQFDEQRTINFVPPDGDFQLMSYQCLQNVTLPFTVQAQVVQQGPQKLLYRVKISLCFPNKVLARDVVLTVPTPRGAVARQYTQTLLGKCKFHPEDNAFRWKISKFAGQQEQTLTGEVELGTNESVGSGSGSGSGSTVTNWARPPMNLAFNIDMYLSSGLTVKYLKVHEQANYRTVKWVKYATLAGSYDIRY